MTLAEASASGMHHPPTKCMGMLTRDVPRSSVTTQEHCRIQQYTNRYMIVLVCAIHLSCAAACAWYGQPWQSFVLSTS